MPERHRELWFSLAGVLAITALYGAAYAQRGAFPAASGLIGHGIGILGFVLMLLAQTLYSVRKRLTDARWGSAAAWFRGHIVMGIVGPWMVLLHTAMSFQGLAGLTMMLTGVVVVSGAVGRYLYTRAPRAVAAVTPGDGSGLSARRRVLSSWRAIHVPLTWLLFAAASVHIFAALYYVTLPR